MADNPTDAAAGSQAPERDYFQWLIDVVPQWWKDATGENSGTTIDVSTGSVYIAGIKLASKGDYILQIDGKLWGCPQQVFEAVRANLVEVVWGEWRPISEPPDHDNDVLVLMDGNDVEIGFWDETAKAFDSYHEGWLKNATYWISLPPLPAPPEEEKVVRITSQSKTYDGLVITVKPRHIIEGRRCSRFHCPVNRAIKDRLRNARVVVQLNHILINDVPYKVPHPLRNFMNLYDDKTLSKQHIAGTTFTLRLL
jgi:hypothetical protein